MISDGLTRKEHKSNKELVGQGVANVVAGLKVVAGLNVVAGLFGGLPDAGATMGTVVNIQARAKSAFSGVARAVVLLVVIFGAPASQNIFHWRYWRQLH